MKAFILSKLLIATCLLSLTHADMTFGEDPGAVYPMALLPFKERGKNTKDLDNMVTDLLFAELVSKPELFLVEREDIESAFKELELNLSGVVAPGEATKVGHLTGARILVTGSVLDVNGKLYLIAKVMGTETTRVKGMSVKGKRGDDLDVLIANLGDAIAKTILNNADSLIAKSVFARRSHQVSRREAGWREASDRSGRCGRAPHRQRHLRSGGGDRVDAVLHGNRFRGSGSRRRK